jgi:putative membrane protein
MKRKRIALLRITAVTITASAFAFVMNASAQTGNTSTSDNPHLRKRDEPAKQQQVKLSAKDKDFLQTAANAGSAEVADGKVAQQRAQNGEVKSIANRIVADHTRANKELTELAKKKGLGMDLTNGKPRNWAKDNFDGQYLASMESDHKADIKTFEKEAASGEDAEIKAWAGKSLPMLKSHLSMVQSAQKSGIGVQRKKKE